MPNSLVIPAKAFAKAFTKARIQRPRDGAPTGFRSKSGMTRHDPQIDFPRATGLYFECELLPAHGGIRLKVLGIDPGTVSFDLCLLDGRQIVFEDNNPSTVVAEHPEQLAEKCVNLKPDAIMAPSGYGLPIRKLSEVTAREMAEVTVVRKGEHVPVLDGMHQWFDMMGTTGIEVYFLPGVIQLPTVPRWRKFNKIDMGTTDKMCIAALSVELMAKGGRYSKVNHVVVEMGGGYNCVMAVAGGQIVNGIGGTNFPGPGFMNSGAMDGEVAYVLRGFDKALLFEGGASHLAGGATIDGFTAENHPDAFNAFVEGILFAVCSQRTVVDTREVLLSGRLTRSDHIFRPVKDRLEKLGYRVRPMPVMSSKSKAAAQGYAVVGNGILGGEFQSLVKHMQIDQAAGSIMDNIYWKMAR